MTSKNKKFYFTVSINDDQFSVITIREGAYELNSLNDEFKRSNIKEGYFTEENYQFVIKPNFSTLGSLFEFKLSSIGSQISFIPGDSPGDLLGFDAVTSFEKYILSPNPVGFLSFDNIFLECVIVQGITQYTILQWMLILVINILKNSEKAYNGK